MSLVRTKSYLMKMKNIQNFLLTPAGMLATGGFTAYTTKVAVDFARSYNWIGDNAKMGSESTPLLVTVGAIQLIASIQLINVGESVIFGELDKYDYKKTVPLIIASYAVSGLVIVGLTSLAIRANIVAQELSVFGVVTLSTAACFSTFLLSHL